MAKKKRKRKPSTGSRGYEAARQTPAQRFPIGANQSPDSAAEGALNHLRDWGRYLDENHDVASAALDEFVKGVVGTGIITIPKPLNPDGSINESLGVQIMRAWERWTRLADVTNELDWDDCQRMICRAWARDGEHFVHHVSGRAAGYPFTAQQVPYRVELLESEMIPWELTENDWRQGIRFNEWRSPLEYAVHRTHPGDLSFSVAFPSLDTLKRLPSRLVTHIKMGKRWPATRGIGLFSAVISRLYGLKDLEESERLKNRNLAAWVAAIIKNPDIAGHESTDNNGNRFHQVFGGMVIDSLAPGESIAGVGPDYPTANMPDHMADQLRRVAAGVGVRYSSLSKHYEGSYSAMRQEMVESVGHYKIREDNFVQKIVREVYERWIVAASLSGMLTISPDADMQLIQNAEYRGPVVPWIDPLKEVQADALSVAEGFADIDQIRIKRGAPAEMIGQPAPQAARPPTQLRLLDEESEEAA